MFVKGAEKKRRGLTETMDPNELACAFQNGDENAFSRLIDIYQEQLYRIAYRITLDSDDAMDVAQDAFIRVYHNIASWDARSKFSSWLFRITSNLAIDVVRKRNRDRRAKDLLSREQQLVSQATQDEALVAEDRKLLLQKVEKAIEALPPSQRAIVALRHYEGMALAEIAEVRGCAVGTIKSTLHQAFQKLRHSLRADFEAARSIL